MQQPTERDDNATNPKQRKPPSGQGGGAVYGLGFIGALVWFQEQADGPRDRLVGVGKAFVWPALLVHDAFKALRD